MLNAVDIRRRMGLLSVILSEQRLSSHFGTNPQTNFASEG